MLLCLYPIFLVISYLFGNVVNEILAPNESKKNSFVDFALNLTTGYSLYLLSVHLINFLFKNLLISCLLIIGIFLITIFIYYKKLNSLTLNKYDYIALIFSLIIASLMAFKDFLYGNPDNFHIAFTASISENNIYPPIFPSTFDMTMSSYHYGVDLIGAIFMKLFHLSSWDAQTLQIFFDVSLCMISLYALILYFTQRSSISLISTIFVTFYTSINSIDFIFREFMNIFDNDFVLFLRTWLIASWTSVSHLSSQLRLPSQNSAFFFAFILIIVLAKTIYEKKNYYPAIIATAFGLYFTFPAFFYPILAALGLIMLYSLLRHCKESTKETTWQSSLLKKDGLLRGDCSERSVAARNDVAGIVLLCCLALVIGKFLTFTHTDTGGVKALTFSLSPYWISWGKSYLNYFYDSFYLQNLGYAFDFAHPAYHPKIPIFSSITFREFGFDALVALAIASYQIRNKKINFSIILVISAIISMLVPLVIEFSPRPIETTRFLHWTKVALVIFNFMYAPYFIELLLTQLKELRLPKLAYQAMMVIIAILSSCLLLPGIASVIPKDEFVITGPNGVEIKHRPVIKELQKLHKSGEVILDSTQFKHGHTIAELAGFFGPGGQMYKSDDISRKSALLSLNPAILDELKIKYILFTPEDKITMEAAYRLAEREIFQKVIELNINKEYYTIYKFNKEKLNLSQQDIQNLQKEYFWILGCDLGQKYEIMRDEQGQIITSHSKEEILKFKKLAKQKLDGVNTPCAFWLKEQIALAPMLGL